MCIKITDNRSIAKQIISGVCWSPVVVIGLAVATFMGLTVCGIFITIFIDPEGLVDLIISLTKIVGVMTLIFGYVIAFLWSNSN